MLRDRRFAALCQAGRAISGHDDRFAELRLSGRALQRSAVQSRIMSLPSSTTPLLVLSLLLACGCRETDKAFARMNEGTRQLFDYLTGNTPTAAALKMED